MWVVYSGEVRGEVGARFSFVLCRMGGVGTWVLLFLLVYVNTAGSMVSSYVLEIICICTLSL